MTDHDPPTHDLALARAERDAWQSTCEELHRTIAGRDVEIEAHLGRCEAADQRARSFEAALTAEREASKGLVAQVEHWRSVGDAAIDRALAAESARDMAEAARDAHADELRAIRDLAAPGNPQGTVADAVRAWIAIGDQRLADVVDEKRAAISRADKAELDRAALLDDIKTAVDRIHRTESDLRAANADRAKLRAEAADLGASARTANDELTKLRDELAKLRAQPVLTDERLREALRDASRRGLRGSDAEMCGAILAALGPVTLPLPAQDRAEELTRLIYGDSFDELDRGAKSGMAERTRAALAKLSPAPAPAFDAAFLRRVLVATKHGPGGRGNPGPCDAACVKCEAERMAKAAPAREVAPTLVAVSDEELAVAFYSEPERPALRECIDAADLAGIRAVRAKLGAAEVTEERLREAIREERHVSSFVAEDTAKGVLARLRATAAKGG